MTRRTPAARAEARAAAAANLASRVELKKKAVAEAVEALNDTPLVWSVAALKRLRDVVRQIDLEAEQLVEAMVREAKP
jgi:fructose-1,6-bisphosphatase/inositol monophosphatase family enzyme